MAMAWFGVRISLCSSFAQFYAFRIARMQNGVVLRLQLEPVDRFSLTLGLDFLSVILNTVSQFLRRTEQTIFIPATSSITAPDFYWSGATDLTKMYRHHRHRWLWAGIDVCISTVRDSIHVPESNRFCP